MRRRDQLIAAALLLPLIGGALYLIGSIVALGDLPDAYASDWTAVFVIEHLKSSDGTWPASWEELRDEFDRLAAPEHYAWSFEALQERVDLRFDVTAAEVRDSEPPLVVLRLKSGKQVRFGDDPNLKIRECLRTKHH